MLLKLKDFLYVECFGIIYFALTEAKNVIQTFF